MLTETLKLLLLWNCHIRKNRFILKANHGSCWQSFKSIISDFGGSWLELAVLKIIIQTSRVISDLTPKPRTRNAC